MTSDSIGLLLGSDAVLPRRDGGVVTEGVTGLQYEIATEIGFNQPIVRSVRTGLYFTLPWLDIISLAKKAGIDEVPS